MICNKSRVLGITVIVLALFVCILPCAHVGVLGPAPVFAQAAAKVGRAVYGKLPDGTVVEAFTLKNASGSWAKVITYGATLTELYVPDKSGKLSDIVLGFDNLDGYLTTIPISAPPLAATPIASPRDTLLWMASNTASSSITGQILFTAARSASTAESGKRKFFPA